MRFVFASLMIAIAVAVVALVLVVANLSAETGRFKEWCVSQGGSVVRTFDDPLCVADGRELFPPSDSDARWP